MTSKVLNGYEDAGSRFPTFYFILSATRSILLKLRIASNISIADHESWPFFGRNHTSQELDAFTSSLHYGNENIQIQNFGNHTWTWLVCMVRYCFGFQKKRARACFGRAWLILKDVSNFYNDWKMFPLFIDILSIVGKETWFQVWVPEDNLHCSIDQSLQQSASVMTGVGNKRYVQPMYMKCATKNLISRNVRLYLIVKNVVSSVFLEKKSGSNFSVAAMVDMSYRRNLELKKRLEVWENVVGTQADRRVFERKIRACETCPGPLRNRCSGVWLIEWCRS